MRIESSRVPRLSTQGARDVLQGQPLGTAGWMGLPAAGPRCPWPGMSALASGCFSRVLGPLSAGPGLGSVSVPSSASICPRLPLAPRGHLLLPQPSPAAVPTHCLSRVEPLAVQRTTQGFWPVPPATLLTARGVAPCTPGAPHSAPLWPPQMPLGSSLCGTLVQ